MGSAPAPAPKSTTDEVDTSASGVCDALGMLGGMPSAPAFADGADASENRSELSRLARLDGCDAFDVRIAASGDEVGIVSRPGLETRTPISLGPG